MTAQLHSLLNQAVQHIQAGRLNEAEALLAKALQVQSRNFDALHILVVVKGMLNKHEEAQALLKKAVRIDPNHNFAQFNLAKALSETGRNAEALPHHRRATELAPRHPEAWLNYGRTLIQLGQPGAALGCFEEALRLHPGYAQAWSNHGECLKRLHRYVDARASLQRSLELDPLLAEAWSNQGGVLTELRRFDEAVACFDQAIRQFEESGTAQPARAQAHFGRGVALFKLKRLDEALASIEKARALDAEVINLHGFRMHVKMHLCEWADFAPDADELLARISAAPPRSRTNPFNILSLPSSPAQQKYCARMFAEDQGFAQITTAPQAEPMAGAKDRIRVGFYSADFRDHPVSQLLVEVIERHDRSRFEFIGLAFNPETGDPLRERMRRAFDRFVDVSAMSDPDVARLSRELGIDIAVNLGGYTEGHRTETFALRAAPIQVSYLGYAGTMGVDFIDYLITDRVACPAGGEADYAEKLVVLPHCLMPHDSTQEIAEAPLRRSDFALPEDGIVFCCFNAYSKITPAVYDSWMRILKSVPGSVLWLSNGHEAAKANLLKEAKARGMDPARIVFAQRMDKLSEHLSRYRLADLFLDTFYYNAHTTALDALWAGVPVLTCAGETFASRVAASLLTSIGLPELITRSGSDYEALAISLAKDRKAIAALKERLAQNKISAPLFNSVRMTRDLEQAFTEMRRRHEQGAPPDHMHVAA